LVSARFDAFTFLIVVNGGLPVDASVRHGEYSICKTRLRIKKMKDPLGRGWNGSVSRRL
jgi:hypothetical protein